MLERRDALSKRTTAYMVVTDGVSMSGGRRSLHYVGQWGGAETEAYGIPYTPCVFLGLLSEMATIRDFQLGRDRSSDVASTSDGLGDMDRTGAADKTDDK